ncbi:gamma-glutamylcyclotransferase [Cupriavidus sp. CuC1]|uniref:gamma-glutamylcyclotransferase n=1 Tax=Cupriavidus sp. CuC1 TaxID=3373131 RepID=UPI0037D887B0
MAGLSQSASGECWVEPSGTTSGVAFHVEEEDLLQELAIIWTREMVVGAYVPTWARVDFADGTTADAILFVANSAHSIYEQDATIETIGPSIARASGPFGSNAEYVTALADALRSLGLVDDYIEELERYLRACPA